MVSQKEYRYFQKETGKLIIFLEQLKLKQAYHTIKHISHYICMSGVRIWTVHLFVVKVEFLTTKLFNKNKTYMPPTFLTMWIALVFIYNS
jgi:hypothetical protein